MMKTVFAVMGAAIAIATRAVTANVIKLTDESFLVSVTPEYIV